MHFLKIIILKGELIRFIIYVDNVQQYMCALQMKFVMIHIGPSLIILYLSLKNILTKFMLFAIHNFERINTTLLLLPCWSVRTHLIKRANFRILKEDC